MEQLAIRSPSDVRLRKGRSAVTNGRRLHVVRPGDTVWARRFRDVLSEIISDLGGHDGGLSEGQRQLARRCATIAIECEKMEGDAAAGGEINLERYGAMTDRLGRALTRLGLQRRARDITGPTLGELMRLDIEEREREAEEATETAAAKTRASGRRKSSERPSKSEQPA